MMAIAVNSVSVAICKSPAVAEDTALVMAVLVTALFLFISSSKSALLIQWFCLKMTKIPLTECLKLLTELFIYLIWKCLGIVAFCCLRSQEIPVDSGKYKTYVPTFVGCKICCSAHLALGWTLLGLYADWKVAGWEHGAEEEGNVRAAGVEECLAVHLGKKEAAG